MSKKRPETVQSLLRIRENLLKAIKLPEDALPGSLSVSRYRCGKDSCHCTTDEGHEKWALTYMRAGSKRVRHIPTDLVESVRRRVDLGKAFKEEVNEIFGANAELLVLLRREKKKR